MLENGSENERRFKEVLAFQQQDGAGVELSWTWFETLDSCEGWGLRDSGGGDGGEKNVEGVPAVFGG